MKPWPKRRTLRHSHQGLVAGMDIVGIDFRDGILFVPEVLMAAKAMKAGMAILRPLLAETGAPKVGTMSLAPSRVTSMTSAKIWSA